MVTSLMPKRPAPVKCDIVKTRVESNNYELYAQYTQSRLSLMRATLEATQARIADRKRAAVAEKGALGGIKEPVVDLAELRTLRAATDSIWASLLDPMLGMCEYGSDPDDVWTPYPAAPAAAAAPAAI